MKKITGIEPKGRSVNGSSSEASDSEWFEAD